MIARQLRRISRSGGRCVIVREAGAARLILADGSQRFAHLMRTESGLDMRLKTGLQRYARSSSPGLLLNDPAVLNGAKPTPIDDGFGTRAIHVGSQPNVETGVVIPPISLSTTYKQEAVGVHKVRGHSLLYPFGGVYLGRLHDDRGALFASACQGALLTEFRILPQLRLRSACFLHIIT